MLRVTGKLTSWKDDKGYGFIASKASDRPYFVHISAFGSIPRRPQIGDTVELQTATASDGKQQAVHARIAGLEPLPAPRARAVPLARRERPGSRGRSQPPSRRRGWFGAGLALPLAIAAGVYAYGTFQSSGTMAPDTPPMRAAPQPVAAPRFQCAGKTHCSHMTSCEEARFYLNNCPGTEMDGDRDGVPCESQWCGG